MKFEEWAESKGFTPASLTDAQRANLAEIHAKETATAKIPIAVPVGAATPTPTSYEMKLEAARRESERQTSIDAAAGELLEKYKRFPERVERVELVRKAAIEGGWDLGKTQLELMKEQFHTGTINSATRESNDISAEVGEAALARYSGIASSDLEKYYSEQTLDAVDKKYKARGLSLLDAIEIGAKRNGWRGSNPKSDLKGALKAAFRDEDHYEMKASTGPSTYAIPNILANVANLHVRIAFEAVEAEWRKIAQISNVTDYKAISTVSLTGDMTYKKVAKGGEVKHGTFGEVNYTNAASLYALLIGIDEQDLVNDSMSALSSASRRMGRGGALTMNQVFWAEWLDDAAFFATDKSLANYDDGATDSLLTAAGLTNATAIFRAQTDPDGKPMGLRPRILLVPPALEGTALTLMNSETLNLVTATTATSGQGNIWRGRYEVVSSDYLTDSLAWYLLANPQDMPAIEMVFLNGQQMPVVEEAMMAVDRLGITIRGKHSFGARKQEYRAALKMKGAA